MLGKREISSSEEDGLFELTVYRRKKLNKFAVTKLKVEVEDNFSDGNREFLEQPVKNNHGGRFSSLWLELHKLMQWAVGCDDGRSRHFSMEQK